MEQTGPPRSPYYSRGRPEHGFAAATAAVTFLGIKMTLYAADFMAGDKNGAAVINENYAKFVSE